LLQSDLNGVNSKLNSLLIELKNNSNILQNQTLSHHEQQSKNSHPTKAVKILWDSSFNMTTKMYSKKDINNKDELPDRVFVRRNSLLTQMFKVLRLFLCKLRLFFV
jgi:hypothetical protein